MKMASVPDDLGSKNNIHNVSDYDKIEKVVIDIANDPMNKNKPEWDPKSFISKKTGIGNLGPNWIDEAKKRSFSDVPIMCCYVLAEVKLQVPGMQGKLENMIQSSVQGIITDMNRQVFCTVDEWHDLKLEDIPEIGN